MLWRPPSKIRQVSTHTLEGRSHLVRTSILNMLLLREFYTLGSHAMARHLPCLLWCLAVASALESSLPEGGTVENQKLLHAAGEGNLNGVREALDAGANANTRSTTGLESPLHLSGITCNKLVIVALLAAGADVNAQTDSGDTMSMTPLHWFVNMNPCDEEAVGLLLASGANLAILNSEGDTALDMVSRISTRKNIADLLRKRLAEKDEV